MFEIVGLIGLAFAILWIGRIFYILQKGPNEIITGLSAIDQRFSRIESQLAAQVPDPDRDA